MGSATTGDDWTVRLLGALRIERSGRSVRLSHRQERLVVLLAIRSRMHRRAVAATLWPDSPDRKAALSLRVTLHQLRENAWGLVTCEADELRLMGATVDASALCTCGDTTRGGHGQRVG